MTGRWAGLRQFLLGSPASSSTAPKPGAVPGQSVSGGDADAAEARSQQQLQRAMQNFDRLIEDMQKAAERDGLHDDGPMAPTFQGFRFCLQALREMTGSMARIEQRYVSRILSTLDAARGAVAAEVKRAETQMATTLATQQDKMATQIASDIVCQASKGIERHARNFDIKVGVFVAALLAVTYFATRYTVETSDAKTQSAAVATAVADTRTQTLSEVNETETALRAAFGTGGLLGARMWVRFMNWNTNVNDALAECTGERTFVQDNRKACLVPLWLEPAPAALSPSPTVSIPPQPANPLPAPVSSSLTQPEPSAWALPTRPAPGPVQIGPRR